MYVLISVISYDGGFHYNHPHFTDEETEVLPDSMGLITLSLVNSFSIAN